MQLDQIMVLLVSTQYSRLSLQLAVVMVRGVVLLEVMAVLVEVEVEEPPLLVERVFQGKGTQEAQDQTQEHTITQGAAGVQDQLGLIPVVVQNQHLLAVMVGQVKYQVLLDQELCTLVGVAVALIPPLMLVGLALQAVVMAQVLVEQARVGA